MAAQVTTAKPRHSTPQQPLVVDRLGVSVHWLQTGFMDEVRSANLDESSTIYDIEDLSSGAAPGVIRSKGETVTSPRDGRKGAAYVHCLEGEDNVGEASFMLSYSWGYKIGDIIETLTSHCKANKLNPKRTYVWLCCLCINQHRVVEQTKNKQAKGSGMLSVAAVDFYTEFRERVTGIGQLLAMMAPWNDPLYLKRIWCIFEIYTASQHGLEISIAMPGREKQKMEQDLVGENGKLDALYEALSNTRVEKAGATCKEDRDTILGMVKQQPGFTVLNNKVNELLRRWVRGVIDEAVEFRAKAYAHYCNEVGILLRRNGEYDKAYELHQKDLDIQLSTSGKDHPDTATAYNNVGMVLYDKGDYDGALKEFQRALSINEAAFGKDHLETAISYNNIGLALHSKGDHSGALKSYTKGLQIREAALGTQHKDIAGSRSNIGSVLHDQGEYDQALVQYRKALATDESTVGPNHPDTAVSYQNIATTLRYKGDVNGALAESQKALGIRQSVYGNDHPRTAESYNDIGLILSEKRDFAGALAEFRKALVIEEAALGPDHPETAITYNHIGWILKEKGDHDAALLEYQKALTIRKRTLDKDNPQLAESHNNVGLCWHLKGDYDRALAEYRKAILIDSAAFGGDHPHTAMTMINIASALREQGNYTGAMDEYQKAFEINRRRLGADHPSTVLTRTHIENLRRDIHSTSPQAREGVGSPRKAGKLRKRKR